MSDIKEYTCKETDDGKLVCQGKTENGVCELVKVPDGHGGWKLDQQHGEPGACNELEEIVKKKT